MSNPTAYLMFIVGLVLVIKGADWFVEAAVWMAKDRYAEVLVGATIVSVGLLCQSWQLAPFHHSPATPMSLLAMQWAHAYLTSQ